MQQRFFDSYRYYKLIDNRPKFSCYIRNSFTMTPTTNLQTVSIASPYKNIYLFYQYHLNEHKTGYITVLNYILYILTTSGNRYKVFNLILKTSPQESIQFPFADNPSACSGRRLFSFLVPYQSHFCKVAGYFFFGSGWLCSVNCGKAFS